MCVGVGVTWSGLCYGLKEPGDSRALRDPHSGNKSPRPPASVRCKCVFPFFSFSVPSTSQFHLCYFHPLSFQFNLHPPLPLHPSVPPRELQILSEAKSILRCEQPSQQQARAAALKLPSQLLYLTSYTICTHTHKHTHLHSLAEYALAVQS